MIEADEAPDALRCAADYAQGLLDDLREDGRTDDAAIDACHPDVEWAASGAMALAGFSNEPPLLAPAPLASAARGAAAALSAVAHSAQLPGHERLRSIDAAALTGERAALSGFSRRGRTSPGGSCHLLPSRDGWIAVNLARADDVALLPAWLGEGDTSDALAFVGQRIRARDAAELVATAHELGLPVAEAVKPSAIAPPWYRTAFRSTPSPERRARPPFVVDMSSLWAGPLATHLLSLAGARVIKVESTRRPDGARRGPQAFYDLLNAGKESVALDFTVTEGRRALAALLDRADIVIEASRPRALAQLGIDVETIVGRSRSTVWVSITGYGREEPGCNWVAFGDDAGVAAGLAMAMCERAPEGGLSHDAPVFCADAIADPLTGVHAALAALSAWHKGGGVLLDVNLRDVAAHVLGLKRRSAYASLFATTVAAAGESGKHVTWEVHTPAGTQRVLEPRARAVAQHAARLGAHTETVLKEIGITC